ncbi:MAG: sugar nucleotide-binding protein [Bdellovibrionales bacterium]|nr:sugar nucleotide-binding protein [Bdellovibrionales bacterium]
MRKTKAILIVGGSGYLGSRLAAHLRDGYKVFATYTSHPTRLRGVTYLPFTVFDRDWIKRVMFSIQPEVIFYLAGSDNAAWAERHAREADRIHVSGAVSVLTAAEILQPKFIYLSNSLVFDGKRGNYHETDVVLPSSALGKAKLGGENFIKGRSINYIILRTSPSYGQGTGRRHSFLDRIRIGLERGERLELQDDEAHSFCPTDSLCEVMAKLVEGGPRNSIIHYGGLTKVSHYEFARRFAARFGLNGAKLAPAASAHAEQHDYSLNSSQAFKTLKVQPLLLEEGFDLLEQKLVRGA